MFGNPLKKVPENLREEYRASVQGCIQKRVRVFALTIYALYLAVIGITFFTHPSGDTPHRLRVLGILTLGVGGMLIYNRITVKCIHTAKLSAFLFILYMLFLLDYGPIHDPTVFTYGGHMLMLLFSTLLFPWFFRDAVVISALHIVAFFIYCGTRDLSVISIPSTAFGSDPQVNGYAFIILTAVLCLLIRYKDNQRDIYNFVLLKDVEAKKAQMESELEFASQIQDSLVPQPLQSPHADVHITYKPMESLGGDYANFQMLDENRLIFFIGDVTGHGVPAALMVNRLHSEFDRLADSGLRPGEILRDLNRFILKSFSGTTMYLTAFCGMVDFKEKKISYSNYGHPPQYIFRLHEAAIEGLESQTSLLGFDIDDGNVTYENEMDYQEGDMIFMFTDGILEHKNGLGEEYGSRRLQEFIKGHSELDPKEIHTRLMQDLSDFGVGRFKDDVFILSILCKEKVLNPA